MDAPARQFCPLCRGELCMPDAVRTHLVADHKRSAAEADELIARFDMAQPIPEPGPEPHMYCAPAMPGSNGRLGHDSAAAPVTLVN
jgi:hypothetical protein